MPGSPSAFRVRLARRLRRLRGLSATMPLAFAAKVLPGMPERVVLWLADVLGFVLYVGDRRGRRAGIQNLECVFGDEHTSRERRRILRASYRSAVRSVVLLFHLRPLTPKRWARWVRVPPEDEQRFRAIAAAHKKGVVVSAHFGNWELLLAARAALPYAPPIAYMAETSAIPEIDAFFGRLRDHGAGSGALRKGGARVFKRALDDGKCVSILVDRNMRRGLGGRYVPFLGLEARTTPLPALLARHYDVALGVALMIPEPDGRYRFWIGPDLTRPWTDDEDADVDALMRRVNDALSEVIRAHPESWLWLQKRFKSRPTLEQGPYPAYSLYDPD